MRLQRAVLFVFMARLKINFPDTYQKLLHHKAHGGFLSGALDDVAERVWTAVHLYLLWLDEGDGDMPVDAAVRSEYTARAGRLSIEQEAEWWLHHYTNNLSRAEIGLLLFCVSKKVGTLLQLSGAADDNARNLIARRDHNNPALAARDNTVAFQF